MVPCQGGERRARCVESCCCFCLPLHVRSVKLQLLTLFRDFVSPAVFFPLLWPSGGLFFLLRGEAGRWRTGLRGQAILGQADGVMIADADWPASHSHPRISLCGQLRPKHVQSLPIIISVLSPCSFAMAKNTHTKESAAQNRRFTSRFKAVAF